MFSKLPFKEKYLFFSIAVMISSACYFFAFRKTFVLWQDHNTLENKLLKFEDVTYQPQFAERVDLNLDRIIELYKIDTTEFRSSILNRISIIAERENVKLTEVPERDPLIQFSGILVEKLNFEGSYFSLLQFLRTIEKTRGIGIVRSVSIRKMKEEKLVLQIFFEFISGNAQSNER